MSSQPGLSKQRVYLIRHGEVHNPQHVVYADLPGFSLSERGSAQAEATADRLEPVSLAAVVSSPLERAVQTAAAVAQRHGLEVTIDEELTEWRMADRWAGIVWEDLVAARPGELEAYLEHPHELPFATESLDDLATRVGATVRRYGSQGEAIAVVSHQDPIQAGRFRLTGKSWEGYQSDKPAHASIIEIEQDDDSYVERSYWEPEQGEPFPPSLRRSPENP